MPIDKRSYPEGSRYGVLLNWHLSIWGTRPEFDPERQNKCWEVETFTKRIFDIKDIVNGVGRDLFGKQRDIEFSKRLVNIWRIPNSSPPSWDEVAENILNTLFGDWKTHRKWREDLKRAREKQIAEAKAARAITRSRRKGESGQKPAFSTASQPMRTGMPRLTPHFIGREEDMRAVLAMLPPAPGSAAILIQGGPGMGKTELTKAIAHADSVVSRFGERRWFVSLAAASSADKMQSAIINALGAAPTQNFRAALDTLRGKQSLLILDNLETPWESTDGRGNVESTLAELGEISGLTVFSSMRGFDFVGGLLWNGHCLGPLSRTGAVELFASIAGNWVLSDPDLSHFIAVLGGIPLAIDLIARRAHCCRSLLPLWKEWLKNGVKLANDCDGDQGSGTSLSSSIEISLFSGRMKRRPEALRLFYFLGILPSGICEEDCQELMGDYFFDATELLIKLGLAIRKENRIDLLPPIREYSSQNLDLLDSDLDAINYHYMNLLKFLSENLGKEQGNDSYTRFFPEILNVECVFANLMNSGEIDVLSAHIKPFAKIMGFGGNTSDVYKVLIDKFSDNGNYLGKAQSIEAIAYSLYRRGKFDESISHYERAISIYHKLLDLRGESDCISIIGQIEITRGNYEAARCIYRKIREIYRSLNIKISEAGSIFSMGDIEFRLKNYDESKNHYQDALSIYEEEGNFQGKSNCLFRLGDLALGRTEYGLAIDYYNKSLIRFQKVGDRRGEAACHKGLGDVALELGDYEKSQDAYSKSLSTYGDIDEKFGMANCLYKIGIIFLRKSNYTESLKSLENSLDIYRELGATYDESCCLDALGDAWKAQSESNISRDYYNAAADRYRHAGAFQDADNCLRKLP